MATATAPNLSFYTSKQAAVRLGVTHARIRQLCGEHREIGTKHGNAWLLTEADILMLKNLGCGQRFSTNNG